MTYLILTLTLAAELQQSTLFRSGGDGYALYRIPGIVTTKRGSLLAYAEARKSASGDWGPTDIVLRRSTDGGKSWSPFRAIASVAGEKTKNPVAIAQQLTEPTPDVTYNNPIAIADGKTGQVHFLFCLEYMRAFYMRSDDDGQTFSPPVEITPAFEKFRPEYPWKVLAIGPGHGIQLRNGRLLAPVWLSTGTGGHAHRPSVNSTLYSDDGGKTWQRGEIAVPDTPDHVFPNETTAAQLSNGHVMLNVRTETKTHRRTIVTSKDGAHRWSKPRFDPQLLEPICFASLLSLGGKRLVFSNPDTLDKTGGAAQPGKNRDRKNLTVQLSEDDGQSWTAKRVIEPGWSGYSDLTVAPNGTIYCFYESGAQEGNAFRAASLTLASFDLAWLKGAKSR
ncbi:MAG: glycoside hydrolase [Bryobacteraceae bacterium]|nr:glycoside hydrolase [Bryobacteraceae bacterium]